MSVFALLTGIATIVTFVVVMAALVTLATEVLGRRAERYVIDDWERRELSERGERR